MTQPQAAAFDFLLGKWNVRHRRLKERLYGCEDWQEFSGQMHAQPILGGQGNMDDNLLNLPDGPYRAISLRTYDPENDIWAIWWLDNRTPHNLDVPVKGWFEGGKGTFFADDILNGTPIKVRFQWTRITTATPRWEQAFSSDGGLTWEGNWTMDFSRME